MNISIEAHGLSKNYENQSSFFSKAKAKSPALAVRDLSFQIHEGESVAFLGPNGAGKSTTIKMLCGILTPSQGTAQVAGFAAGSREGAKNIGLVFGTRSQLFMHMTVEQCLEIISEIYFITGAQKKKRLSSLIDQFEISKLLKQRVRSLSLGQRMRCEVAAALIHQPKVLLADEPTIGLDVIAKSRLRELILRWQREEKTTLLLTSHDLSDVEALCDRCILIDHGEKVFDGTLENLKGDLRTLRRISIRTLSPSQSSPRLQENPGLTMATDLTQKRDESERSYFHDFEIKIDQTPLAQTLSFLAKSFEGQIADIEIQSVPLEEVMANLYRRQVKKP